MKGWSLLARPRLYSACPLTCSRLDKVVVGNERGGVSHTGACCLVLSWGAWEESEWQIGQDPRGERLPFYSVVHFMQEHVTFENLCIFPESNGGFLIRL